MADLAALERRIAVAEAAADAPAHRQPEPQRRRTSVATFNAARAAALADPATTATKRARLEYGGAGVTTAALSAMAGVSRESLRKAEADPESVSAATLRRLATALSCRVADLR